MAGIPPPPPIRIMPPNPEHQQALEEHVKKLRDYGAAEFAIHTPEKMAEFLNRLGFVNGRGKAITKRTIMHWRDKRDFPAAVIRYSDGLMTTNVLIQAWLWSINVWRKNKPYRSPKLKPKPAVCLAFGANVAGRDRKCGQPLPCLLHSV